MPFFTNCNGVTNSNSQLNDVAGDLIQQGNVFHNDSRYSDNRTTTTTTNSLSAFRAVPRTQNLNQFPGQRQYNDVAGNFNGNARPTGHRSIGATSRSTANLDGTGGRYFGPQMTAAPPTTSQSVWRTAPASHFQHPGPGEAAQPGGVGVPVVPMSRSKSDPTAMSHQSLPTTSQSVSRTRSDYPAPASHFQHPGPGEAAQPGGNVPFDPTSRAKSDTTAMSYPSSKRVPNANNTGRRRKDRY